MASNERTGWVAVKSHTHLLDHWQNPGLCIVVTVGTNSLATRESTSRYAACTIETREKIPSVGRSKDPDVPDRPCSDSDRPCKPASARRGHPRGPGAPPRRGSLLLMATPCGLRCSGGGRGTRNGGVVVMGERWCEVWTPFLKATGFGGPAWGLLPVSFLLPLHGVTLQPLQ